MVGGGPKRAMISSPTDAGKANGRTGLTSPALIITPAPRGARGLSSNVPPDEPEPIATNLLPAAASRSARVLTNSMRPPLTSSSRYRFSALPVLNGVAATSGTYIELPTTPLLPG